MILGKIVVGVAEVGEWGGLEITDIVSDSRKVRKGSLFVAYKGVAIDGHEYIDQAIKNGAVAVVGEKPMTLSIPYFQVENGRLTWAKMIANLYDNPEKKLKIVGVTGTDGKTTTTNLIYEMLRTAGKKVSMISTIKAVVGGREFDTGLHTSSPDPDVLWPWLAEAVKNGDTHMVLETTSHGLAQYRFGNIVFEVGVLTNFAHDHLDFHKTLEGYRDAKAKLFEQSRMSILNKCSNEFEFFKSRAFGRVIAYDLSEEIRVIKYVEESDGITQEFEILIDGGWKTLRTSLLGDYNLENILAASKTAISLGIDFDILKSVIDEFRGLPGRFQLVPNTKGIRTIVDFAHTEQGIKSVVGMVKEHLLKNGERLVVVFGCNGGRDQTKRAPMGRAACELADLVVVTTEDPRNEPVDQIFSQIEEGCIAAGGRLNKTFFRVDDRKEAIEFAINKLAEKGDWVLFLGKGHEQSMNIDGEETPWNEPDIVSGALG